MSQFEFIFVLISIIAGLALAQLLSGMTRPPRESTGRIDIAHVAFSAGVTVLLITVWWSTFRWQTYETWTVIEFLLLCFYVSLFYVKAVILSPLRASELPASLRTITWCHERTSASFPRLLRVSLAVIEGRNHECPVKSGTDSVVWRKGEAGSQLGCAQRPVKSGSSRTS